jgi:hypothetical protein
VLCVPRVLSFAAISPCSCGKKAGRFFQASFYQSHNHFSVLGRTKNLSIFSEKICHEFFGCLNSRRDCSQTNSAKR